MTYTVANDVTTSTNIAVLADAWRQQWSLLNQDDASLAAQKACADRMQTIETRIAELTKRSDLSTDDVRDAVDIALRIIAEKIPSPAFRRVAA